MLISCFIKIVVMRRYIGKPLCSSFNVHSPWILAVKTFKLIFSIWNTQGAFKIQPSYYLLVSCPWTSTVFFIQASSMPTSHNYCKPSLI